MIDITALKRRTAPTTAHIGARIDVDTKQWLESFCATERVSLSSLLAELLRSFKEQQLKSNDSAEVK